jgi:hypothetical protein
MEHVRAPSKDLSTRNVLCIGIMVIWACGLHPNAAKVPNFQYRAWLYSMDQKCHGDDEKTRDTRFWELPQWPTAIIRPKSQNSNIRHDGILSVRNFMLMINSHVALFLLPGNLFKKQKMCSLFPWQHAISYLFSFYIDETWNSGSVNAFPLKRCSDWFIKFWCVCLMQFFASLRIFIHSLMEIFSSILSIKSRICIRCYTLYKWCSNQNYANYR